MTMDSESVYNICHCKSAEPLDRAGHLLLTASLRFDGAVNVDVTEFQTNLIPYPRAT